MGTEYACLPSDALPYWVSIRRGAPLVPVMPYDIKVRIHGEYKCFERKYASCFNEGDFPTLVNHSEPSATVMVPVSWGCYEH